MELAEAGEWSSPFSRVSRVKGNQSFLFFCKQFPFQPAGLGAETRPSSSPPPPRSVGWVRDLRLEFGGAVLRMRRPLPASVSYRLGASSGFLTSVFVLLNPSDNSVKRLLSELAFISRWALSLKVTILKRRTIKISACCVCQPGRAVELRGK